MEPLVMQLEIIDGSPSELDHVPCITEPLGDRQFQKGGPRHIRQAVDMHRIRVGMLRAKKRDRVGDIAHIHYMCLKAGPVAVL
jgi:hypothetical protein